MLLLGGGVIVIVSAVFWGSERLVKHKLRVLSAQNGTSILRNTQKYVARLLQKPELGDTHFRYPAYFAVGK